MRIPTNTFEHIVKNMVRPAIQTSGPSLQVEKLMPTNTKHLARVPIQEDKSIELCTRASNKKQTYRSVAVAAV